MIKGVGMCSKGVGVMGVTAGGSNVWPGLMDGFKGDGSFGCVEEIRDLEFRC